MPAATKSALNKLYNEEKISPAEIALQFGVTQRTIYNWFRELGIASLGPTHLRKGKSATWMIGIKHSPEAIAKNRAAHLGRKPGNFGNGRVRFNCEVCGKEVFDKPYRRKHTCSIACNYKRSTLIRGEKHWNYIGDEATKPQRKRNWSAYREWHRAVLRSDRFTCRKCHKIGGRLTAHHICNWSKYPEKRFEISNGATLCWKCHWSFHRQFGHKHTTAEMFDKWLTMLQ